MRTTFASLTFVKTLKTSITLRNKINIDSTLLIVPDTTWITFRPRDFSPTKIQCWYIAVCQPGLVRWNCNISIINMNWILYLVYYVQRNYIISSGLSSSSPSTSIQLPLSNIAMLGTSSVFVVDLIFGKACPFF